MHQIRLANLTKENTTKQKPQGSPFFSIKLLLKGIRLKKKKKGGTWKG